MLLDAFLLELAGSKDQVNGPSTCTEAGLALGEGGVNFPGDPNKRLRIMGPGFCLLWQEGDSSVVVARLAISFPFVYMDNCGISEFLWQLFLDSTWIDIGW